MTELGRFVGEFLRHPLRVGAIAPSSRYLARAMVDWIDWDHVAAVAEYGPGTGAFTGALLERLNGTARFFAVEINPKFAALIRERYPQVTVHEASVADIRPLCDREGLSGLDAIVCGLPWAAFSSHDQACFLDAMMTVLRPGGRFATFAYLQGLLLPAARRFRRRLDAYFGQVTTSPVVWANLPPAVVYRCRR